MSLSRASFLALVGCAFCGLLSCSGPKDLPNQGEPYILSASTTLEVGEKAALSFHLGKALPTLPSITWLCDGGTLLQGRVKNEVIYEAPLVEGHYTVRARAQSGNFTRDAELFIQVGSLSPASAEKPGGQSGNSEVRARANGSQGLASERHDKTRGPLARGYNGPSPLYRRVIGAGQDASLFLKYRVDATYGQVPSVLYRLDDGFLRRQDMCFEGASASFGYYMAELPSFYRLSGYSFLPEGMHVLLDAGGGSDGEASLPEWFRGLNVAQLSPTQLGLGTDLTEKALAQRLDSLKSMGFTALDLLVTDQKELSRCTAGFLDMAKTRSLHTILDLSSLSRALSAPELLDSLPNEVISSPALSGIILGRDQLRSDALARLGSSLARLRRQNPEFVLFLNGASAQGLGDEGAKARMIRSSAFSDAVLPFLGQFDSGREFLSLLNDVGNSDGIRSSLYDPLVMDREFSLALSRATGGLAENERDALTRMAIALLYTAPGIPQVALFDASAPKDEGQPEKYAWIGRSKSSLDFLRAILRLRSLNPALAYGAFEALPHEGSLAAFCRWDSKNRYLIIANPSADELSLDIGSRELGLGSGERLRRILDCQPKLLSLDPMSLSPKVDGFRLVLKPRSFAIYAMASHEIPLQAAQRPRITSIFPPDHARDVPADSRVVLEFSEEMDQASVLQGFTISPEIDGHFIWNSRVCSFLPELSFTRGQVYTVRLSRSLRAQRGGYSLQEGKTFGFSVH